MATPPSVGVSVSCELLNSISAIKSFNFDILIITGIEATEIINDMIKDDKI
jgi:hypothetical protein